MFDVLANKLDEIINQARLELSVSVSHLETGEQYQRNAEAAMYAASIIKVPIMVAVFDEVHKGRLRLDERITVAEEDKVTGSGSLQYLTPNLSFSISDLVTLMIVESDNTATNLLIDKLGLDHIQYSMKTWGLRATQLHHKLQIIPAVPNPRRNVITAAEMTDLLTRMAQGKVISYKACKKMIEIMKGQMFNEGIPSLLPEDDGWIGAVSKWEFAHKTGWVTGIEHDTGILYLQGHTFAVSVCARNFTSRAEVHRAMGEIGCALYDTVYQP